MKKKILFEQKTKQKLEKSSKLSVLKKMIEKKECLETMCETQRNQSYSF